jgi:triacylglycerol esterase/lipase EstA (alpha/beta hydrolase family)
MTHRVYFVPGMFGFAKLAGYDYFNHLRRGIERRFADAGLAVVCEDIPAPPTSSLRYRSRVLAMTVARTAGDQDPIHLVGHSTGGLDVRLVLSPAANLGVDAPLLAWRGRVVSAVTINTPHYGTPVAGYFATVSGTRVLYALSLFTVVSLTLGEPSLAIFSRLLAGLGGIDALFGEDLKLVSRVTDGILRFVDRDGREEISQFLGKIRGDQGAIVQTMPEAMDLFNAATENRVGVRYASVATAAPPPRSLRIARRIRSPYAVLTAAMYSTLYQFAGQRPRIYPYAKPTPRQMELLRAGIDHEISDTTSDGIVPTLSMIWGDLVWAGEADHLDVIGHFHDDHDPPEHVDWITSGSRFTRKRFEAMLDAIVAVQIARTS